MDLPILLNKLREAPDARWDLAYLPNQGIYVWPQLHAEGLTDSWAFAGDRFSAFAKSDTIHQAEQTLTAKGFTFLGNHDAETRRYTQNNLQYYSVETPSTNRSRVLEDPTARYLGAGDRLWDLRGCGGHLPPRQQQPQVGFGACLPRVPALGCEHLRRVLADGRPG